MSLHELQDIEAEYKEDCHHYEGSFKRATAVYWHCLQGCKARFRPVQLNDSNWVLSLVVGDQLLLLLFKELVLSIGLEVKFLTVGFSKK